MSTKATIQAIIDEIADGEPNTALEARTAYNAILNELFPTVYYSAWNANVKTASLLTGFRYFLTFQKTGNRVFLNGFFTTSLGAPIDTDVFAFTDDEFNNLNNGTDITDFTFETSSGYRFTMTDGVFQTKSVIPLNTPIYFNFSYPTNP